MSTRAEPVSTEGQQEAPSGPLPTNGMFAYVAPMIAFLLLTSLESYLPSPSWYPIAYAAKMVAVALVALFFRSTWIDLRPLPGVTSVALATVLGLVVTVLWVGLDGHYPMFEFLGKRSAFDPTTLGPVMKRAFVGIRMVGLVLLVPLIEELFWRSFLMRWLIDPDFEKVTVGRVTPIAAGVTSLAFALAHPEWLPALLTGLLWAGLLWKTGSLFACVVSHSTANLALGLYVLATGEWKFW